MKFNTKLTGGILKKQINIINKSYYQPEAKSIIGSIFPGSFLTPFFFAALRLYEAWPKFLFILSTSVENDRNVESKPRYRFKKK